MNKTKYLLTLVSGREQAPNSFLACLERFKVIAELCESTMAALSYINTLVFESRTIIFQSVRMIVFSPLI